MVEHPKKKTNELGKNQRIGKYKKKPTIRQIPKNNTLNLDS